MGRVLTPDEKHVKELVACFNTPIVYEPGGWDQDIPAWLPLRVIAERVAMVDDGGWTKATDAEVTCHMFTACLNHPVGSEWTGIVLFEAAKQIPGLYDALEATPRSLTSDQQRLLEDLKFKIRNSQLRHSKSSKEDSMATKRKLIIEERASDVLIGIMRENTDPVTKVIPGALDEGLAAVPALVQEAEAKWATSPRNPTHKAPVEPKKETKPAAVKTGTATAKDAGQGTSEDLPLLSGVKPKKDSTIAPDSEAAQKIHEIHTGTGEITETPLSGTEKGGEVTKTAENVTKIPEVVTNTPSAVVDETVAKPPASTVETKPATDGTVTTPPASRAATATGAVEYFLKDGRGPFDSVQLAMDAMGLDKKDRPQHNRWDRLSTALKDQIQRKAKQS